MIPSAHWAQCIFDRKALLGYTCPDQVKWRFIYKSLAFQATPDVANESTCKGGFTCMRMSSQHHDLVHICLNGVSVCLSTGYFVWNAYLFIICDYLLCMCTFVCLSTHYTWSLQIPNMTASSFLPVAQQLEDAETCTTTHTQIKSLLVSHH